VRWHTADLLNRDELQRLIDDVRPTHLLHLAWYTEPGLYWNSPANLAWAASTLELIRAFGEAGGQRAVLAGTCAEYDVRRGPCQEGVTPEWPTSLYGDCKLAAGRIGRSFASHRGFELACGRLFYVFGPGESASRFVPSVIASLIRGERAVCRHGDLLRDYLYVRDAAAALVALLDSHVTGPVNIASGTPIALRDLVELIGCQVGRIDLVDEVRDADRSTEPPVVAADVTRLATEVGWTPSFSLVAGIDETVAWWRSTGTV
jgi:nucleoside-diphosphate-sugar epimerase